MDTDNHVHQIIVKKASGYNIISKEDYAKLSLNDRTDLLINGKIQFLNSNGDSIPLLDGIRNLHGLKAG